MSDLEAAAAAAASVHDGHQDDQVSFKRSYPRSSAPRRAPQHSIRTTRHSRQGYHPYERHHRTTTNQYSSSSSWNRRPGWTPRPRTIDEVIRADVLLDYAEFLRLDDAPREEEASASVREAAYAAYLQRHRQAILDRFFWAHRRDAWLVEAVSGGQEDDKSSAAHAFKESFEKGQMIDICLEDGPDLQSMAAEGEGANKDHSCRNLPASIRLADRVLPALIDSKNAIIIIASNLPPSLSKERFEEILRDALKSLVDPSAYKVQMTQPQPEKAFYRGAWIYFDQEGGLDMAAVLRALESAAPFENTKLFFAQQPRSYVQTLRLAHADYSNPERILIDLEAARRLMDLLDGRAQLPPPALEYSGGEVRAGLDLMIAYLRRVHHCCYYCGFIGESPAELIQHCGHLHLRSSSSSMHSDQELLDQRIDDLCSVLEMAAAFKDQHDSADEERRIQQEDAVVERHHVVMVEEGRYRCSSCGKLFRGPEFVVKHIRLKHDELVQTVLEEQALLKRFHSYPPLVAVPLRGKTGGGRKGSNNNSSSSTSTSIEDARDRSRGNYHHRSQPPPPPAMTPRGPPEGAPPIPRRPLRAYVDLDAPASGDIEISYD